MVKKILSIIAGYAIFSISSVALFELTGHDSQEQATVYFQLLSAIYGAVFSFIGGLAVQLIARTKTLTLNCILAFMMAGIAALSMVASDGSHWTQMSVIFIFSPVSILGGFFYMKRHNR
jgi:hypothetical protein